MVIQKVEKVILTQVNEIDCTVRGEGGFGHTGKQ
jgi:dUTPase